MAGKGVRGIEERLMSRLVHDTPKKDRWEKQNYISGSNDICNALASMKYLCEECFKGISECQQP